MSRVRPWTGTGTEKHAPPSPAPRDRLARRIVTDLRPTETCWAPVASSMSGDIVPLDDVLDRLVDGLNLPR